MVCIADSYLVSRSKTCCLRLGIVVRASTIVHAACLAAWVAGVNRTCNKEYIFKTESSLADLLAQIGYLDIVLPAAASCYGSV